MLPLIYHWFDRQKSFFRFLVDLQIHRKGLFWILSFRKSTFVGFIEHTAHFLLLHFQRFFESWNKILIFFCFFLLLLRCFFSLSYSFLTFYNIFFAFLNQTIHFKFEAECFYCTVIAGIQFSVPGVKCDSFAVTNQFTNCINRIGNLLVGRLLWIQSADNRAGNRETGK